MTDLNKLFLPFAKEVISWRAQHFKSDGTAALALAYIDARDVMNRLDDVCGVDGWQCEYPHANGKTICSIGIKCGDSWIWKADGAGDTDIEAEKGAISDAFKRAAVKWGVGRYLYDLDAVWVPCHAEQRNGKWVFKEWVVDPWTKVKAAQKQGFPSAKKLNSKWVEIKDSIIGCENDTELLDAWTVHGAELIVFKRTDPEMYEELEKLKNDKKAQFQSDAAMRLGMPQDFNGAHQ